MIWIQRLAILLMSTLVLLTLMIGWLAWELRTELLTKPKVHQRSAAPAFRARQKAAFAELRAQRCGVDWRSGQAWASINLTTDKWVWCSFNDFTRTKKEVVKQLNFSLKSRY